MPGIFVALFWIWTAVSVLILLRRLFTTGTIRPSGKRRKTDAIEPLDPTDKVAEFEAKLAAQPPQEPGTDLDPVDAPTGAVPAGDATPQPPISPDPGADRIPRAETLAEALTGIQMPADLSPLVADAVDPRRMLFTTGTATPEAVGGALADELERLGFELQPLDERSVAAKRADAAVEVRILASAEAARASLGDRIEAVPDHAVITEFQLR